MSRLFRVTVVLLLAAVLTLTTTAGAYAGGVVKSDTRSSVTIEKGPQFMPGMARPVLPAGGAPIKGFPKWPGQYFDSSLFFFWLNLGYYFTF